MAAARRSAWGRRVICLLGCLVLIATVDVAAAESAERLSSFGPDGTEGSNFQGIGSVGVDQQAESIYVLDKDAGELLKFGINGSPVNFGGTSPYISDNRISGLEPFSSLGTVGMAQVAVNSETHVLYVTEKTAVRAFQANGEPAEFTAGLGAGTNKIPGFGELFGIAVDVNGNIYVSDHTGIISVFAPTGALVTSFSVANPHNLAVTGNGAILVIEDARRLKRFSPDVFPVTGGTVYTETEPIPRNGFAFMASISIDPSNQDIYLIETNFGDSWVRRFDQSGVLIESIGEPGSPTESKALGGNSQGIAVLEEERELAGGKFVKFYAADSSAKDLSQTAILGQNFIIGPPSIKSLRVTNVTADSAVLRASINPNTKDTSYQFEYGPEDCSLSACTPVPVGGSAIEGGTEYIPVTQTVLGLTPGITYHYRLLAENELNEPEVPTVESGTFTTQAIGAGFNLSDGRVWEMVSPPNKRGATLVGPAVGSIQAAEDGNGLSYLSRGSIEPDPEGSRNLEAASVMAKRSDGNWVSRDITPMNVRAVPMNLGVQNEYKLFSSNLTSSVLEPRDGTSLSPAASERTPYLRINSEPPGYTPLVTTKEGFANVPSGTEFGGSPDSSVGRVRLSGANPSLSDVVVSSDVSLLEGQPKAPLGIYHWKDSQVRPIGLLPAGEGGKFTQSILGSGPGSVRRAISDDGTRIFWGAGLYNTGINSLSGLYLRDTETEETMRLDVKQPGASGLGEARPVFQGASRDGSVTFFTDTRQLTEDASTSGRDLYRCEIPEEDSSIGCASLTNISGSATVGPGESAEVLGLVSGISNDGSALYFVAKGNLDSVPNENGKSAIPGKPNLYGWQQGVGVRFIATLSQEDGSTWGKSPGRTVDLSATVSPNGNYFAFMSQEDLVGQGNQDADTGSLVQEIFLYNAATEQLDCISCDPTGAAPTGEKLSGNVQMVDSLGHWSGQWVASILPQPVILEVGGISLYQPRAVLDSGRVFFNTLDALVSGDSNGQWDAYQFEPVGVGSCEASSGGQASARSGSGCVSLISSGTGAKESAFLDASVSGDDVFFFTSAQLSVSDKDSEVDVYDARVGGVAAALSPESECVSEECRASTSPPTITSPGSETFVGPGNLNQTKKCPKGKKKVKREGKVRCISRKNKQTPKQGGGKRRRGR